MITFAYCSIIFLAMLTIDIQTMAHWKKSRLLKISAILLSLVVVVVLTPVAWWRGWGDDDFEEEGDV